MKERVRAFDLGRGISVLLMVLVHSLWMYGDRPTQFHSTFGTIVHLIGRGTAMFLVAMGFSFMVDRAPSVRAAVRRGLVTLGIGYGMNALKFIVPTLIFRTMPASFLAAYGWEGSIGFSEYVYLLRTGDILQLAGIALLLMGFVRTFLTDARATLALAIGIALASGPLRGASTGPAFVSPFVDLLWGDTYSVFFPFFPWASVIVLGMHLGIVHRTMSDDLDRYFRYVLRLGLVAWALGAGLVAYDPRYHFNDFFHLGPGGAFELGGVACVLFWLARRLEPMFASGPHAVLVDYCSRHVTSLYVIHWVLICWGMGIVGYQTRSAIFVGLAAPVVLVATLAVDRLLRRLRSIAPRRTESVSVAAE